MQVLDLYHGSTVPNLQAIISGGLADSTHGRLGPGIYFVRDEGIARAISAHRGGSVGNAVVLKVRVTIPSMKKLSGVADRKEGENDTSATWAQEGFAAASGMHPAWLGPAFEEIVVKRAKVTMQILEVSVINGTLPALNAPGITIRAQGNVTISGNLTCDTLTIG